MTSSNISIRIVLFSLHQRSSDQFEHQTEIQLNDEELRQMEMRSYETTLPSNTAKPSDPKTTSASLVSTEKTNKPEQRNDGTVSDSGLSSHGDVNRKKRPSIHSKAFVILGLSKKANSASNLGYGKRCGFQRSEEIGVQPHLRNRALERQTSKENETPSSAPPTGSHPSPFNTSLQRDHCHSMPHDMK